MSTLFERMSNIARGNARASTFRAAGKQVLRDNQHFADAVDTDGAALIVFALEKLKEQPR